MFVAIFLFAIFLALAQEDDPPVPNPTYTALTMDSPASEHNTRLT